MPTAVIIDDEQDARENLRQLLGHYCPSFEVIGEAESVATGVVLLHRQVPHVVFLDIQMQDGTGFELLQAINEPSFRVVFVTAFDQHAIRAFEFNAVDYLLKPIDPARLQKAVERVSSVHTSEGYFQRISMLVNNLSGQSPDRIILQTQEGQHYIRLDDIIRLEADKNYTTFHSRNRKSVVVSETMKRYEDVLPSSQFFRTHQSHIVQRDAIKSFIKESGGYIEMTDGTQVPLSRRRKEAFFAWMRSG